jgi:hypothetical protein
MNGNQQQQQQSIDFSRIDMCQLGEAISDDDVLPDGSELDQYLPPNSIGNTVGGTNTTSIAGNFQPTYHHTFLRRDDFFSDHCGDMQHASIRYHELLPPGTIKLETPFCPSTPRSSYEHHSALYPIIPDYYNTGIGGSTWSNGAVVTSSAASVPTSTPPHQFTTTLPSYQYLQRPGGSAFNENAWPSFV